jgi:hypothetical protein
MKRQLSLKHVNLYRTNRSLFYVVSVFAWLSLAMGVQLLFFGEMAMAPKGYAVLRSIASPAIWGAFWFICGVGLVLALSALPYVLARISLIGIASIAICWSVALYLGSGVIAGNTATPIYGAVAFAALTCASAVPINYTTALRDIKRRKR